VWNGTIGNLIANPRNKSRKAHNLAFSDPIIHGLLGSRIEFEMKLTGSLIESILKLCTSFPSTDGSFTEIYNPIITMRMKIDPSNVYRKNLRDAYSRLGPPHIPIRKNIGSSMNSKKR
jgi:hypothetical protein